MGTGWAVGEGTQIGKYVLYYANGETRELPVKYGIHVRDVLAQPNLPRDEVPMSSGKIVWRGTNAHAEQYGSYFRLYIATWRNPKPDVEVVSIDFVSEMTDCAPLLVAMTVEH